MMGRVNYEAWATYWPAQSSNNPFAAYMNTTKFVVSSTLDTVAWNNSTLISGDVIDKIAKLKQQPGKNISISGSGTLVHSLLHHNLLNEVQLMVHPLIVGSGKRLFTDGDEQKAFTPINARTFSTGVVYLTYHPGNQERKLCRQSHRVVDIDGGAMGHMRQDGLP